MPVETPVQIAVLDPAAAEDPSVPAALAALINEVYLLGEKGLWEVQSERTNAEEVAGFVRAGQIAVARRGDEIVGSVRVQLLDAQTGEFGMLAARPQAQGSGIGRGLVAFAEQQCREAGCVTMQLELLVPQGWTHPTKGFLAEWYTRLGYRVVRKGSLEQDFPHLFPLLATPCDFLIWHKDLRD